MGSDLGLGAGKVKKASNPSIFRSVAWVFLVGIVAWYDTTSLIRLLLMVIIMLSLMRCLCLYASFVIRCITYSLLVSNLPVSQHSRLQKPVTRTTIEAPLLHGKQNKALTLPVKPTPIVTLGYSRPCSPPPPPNHSRIPRRYSASRWSPPPLPSLLPFEISWLGAHFCP
ncbi:hypothetical protein V8C34DRAFT_163365 [Trichoderma compactum]